MSHGLVVRIVQAFNLKLADGAFSGQTNAFVRVKLLDSEGNKLGAEKDTQVRVDCGNNPGWNEYFEFRGIANPSACTLRLEVVDQDDGRQGNVLGAKDFQLGLLSATPGFQQFKEDIAGHVFHSQLRFDLNNFGMWGSGSKEQNKLSITIKRATGLRWWDRQVLNLGDRSDPYVHTELKGPDSKTIGEPRVTKVIQDGGADVEWNEEFEFDSVLHPTACKLVFNVYDKDNCSLDDYLGHAELHLGTLNRSPDPVELEQPLHYEDAKLKYTICNHDAWGNSGEAAPRWAQPVPDSGGQSLVVRIVGATNLRKADGILAGGSDPYCRLFLRDEWGRIVKTESTTTKWNGGTDVAWDEEFVFKDLVNPCACTLALNVLDSDVLSRDDRLGETEFALGRVRSAGGLQEFEEDIAGVLWTSRVKFQIDTHGRWGNGPKGNRLIVKVKNATGLPEFDHIIGTDKSDPYVCLQLKGPRGEDVGETRMTTVRENGGGDVEWNEELFFEELESPAACTLHLSVYDKDVITQDDCCGHTELKLGTLECSPDFAEFDGTALGGTARLSFSVSTGGTWGNKIRPPSEGVDASASMLCPCSCTQM